jgi:hypothetical protein
MPEVKFHTGVSYRNLMVISDPGNARRIVHAPA